MSKLIWDQEGQKTYETGVSNGVLYPMLNGSYGTGVAWNGLINVSESPSGAEPTNLYADNVKYLSLTSAEDFACSIEAYTYPDEFAACDGSAEIATGVAIGQQTRTKFGLVYKTIIGNDTKGNKHGYKIHVVYGCQAAPSEKTYSTVNDSPEAITFSWEVSTTPVEIEGHEPSAILTINSTKLDAAKLATIEAKLFGSAEAEAAILSPGEIIALIA